MDETLSLWAYEWKARGRSEGTLRTMSSELRRFAAGLDKPLESASMGDCLQYLTQRHEVSASTAQYAWRALRSYFAYVAELDGVPSPMARVKSPKVAEPAVTGVSVEDVKRLVAACTGKDAERDRALIVMLACTGLRRGEVAALTVDAVDLQGGVLVIRKTKSGRPRVVPLSSEGRVCLLKYMRVRAKHPHADLPALWLGLKGALGVAGVRCVLRRRSESAQVDVTAHQFRRSFAVNWLTAGGSQTSLQAICGWTSGAMPARYTRHAAGEVALSEYRRLYS